jgi:dTDP-4-dehydrorhamnose reductase
MTTRVLITGATGHLGTRLAERAAAAGWSVVGTYFSGAGHPEHEWLDVRDPAAVRGLLARVQPDAVIHTASGRDDWRVVADGAAHVAVAAAALDVRLIHVSSDALFSGKVGQDGKAVEYDESALPDPIYRYGAAKAAAETAVRAVCPGAAVVRTSLIIGHGRGQHETLTRDLIQGRVHGALFTDMIRKPVHVDDLADALLELTTGDYRGILNVAGPDAINRFDLGVLIARRAGLNPAEIPAGTIADAGTPLPADVRLRTDKAASLLRTRLRGVHEFMLAPRSNPPGAVQLHR